MLLKIKTETGNPLNLNGLTSAIFKFPYRGTKTLEERNYQIVDAENGILKVTLDDFKINGLNLGKSTFIALLDFNDYVLEVEFVNGLNVVETNGVKQLCQDYSTKHIN